MTFKAQILRARTHGKETMEELGNLLGIPVFTSDQEVPKDGTLTFRWGCRSLDLSPNPVINKKRAIEEVSDKRGFRLKLEGLCLTPATAGSFEEFLDRGFYTWRNKWIVRPARHHRSENLYFCSTVGDVYRAVKEIDGPLYISEHIPKTNEYRVFVCQGRIAWIIEKIPRDRNSISWGCVNQGDFRYVPWTEWSENLSYIALKTMRQSSLDFGAVDIVFCRDETVLGFKLYRALEVNTAPYLSPYYTKTVAKTFKWIMTRGREHFPEPQSYSWRDVIHPAVQMDLENI